MHAVHTAPLEAQQTGSGHVQPDPIAATAGIFAHDPDQSLIVHTPGTITPKLFALEGIGAVTSSAQAGSWAKINGVLTSPVLERAAGFQDALVSWNMRINKAESGGARIELRVGKRQGDFWSPWMYVGKVGNVSRTGVQEFKGSPSGKVDTDFFTSADRFDRLQYRISALGSSAEIYAVSIVLGDRERSASDTSKKTPHGPAIARLGLPFLSQKTSRSELSGRLCSPTSLSMVLIGSGVATTVERTSNTVYDADFDIYGNWPRNVQGAFELDRPGMLVRFNTWPQVEQVLRSGTPIIASIRVEPGQLRGSPYKATDGHLIVIEGMDDAGDFLVLDPASGSRESGALTYRRNDMAQVWLQGSNGTAYLIFNR